MISHASTYNPYLCTLPFPWYFEIGIEYQPLPLLLIRARFPIVYVHKDTKPFHTSTCNRVRLLYTRAKCSYVILSGYSLSVRSQSHFTASRIKPKRPFVLVFRSMEDTTTGRADVDVSSVSPQNWNVSQIYLDCGKSWWKITRTIFRKRWWEKATSSF